MTTSYNVIQAAPAPAPQTVELSGGMALLLFVAIFAFGYLCVREMSKRSPWGQLSKTFLTNRKVTIPPPAYFKSGSVTIRKDDAIRQAARVRGVYQAVLPEGYLLCGGFLGEVLKLNRNILVPWSAMEISSQPVGDFLPKFLKALSGTLYIAKIKTRDGVFRLHLDAHQIKEATEKGWIKAEDIKEGKE